MSDPGREVSYESRIERLEAIVTELEGDGVPLDRALALFEEGIELLRTASDSLTQAEGRVALLIERAEGILDTRDVDV